MTEYHGAETALKGPEVSLDPDIADSSRVVEAEIAPSDIHPVRECVEIVQRDIDIAVACVGHPHGVVTACHLHARTPRLIDRQKLVVLERRLGEAVELGQIASQVQR